MDRETYEKELAERQRNHLQRVHGEPHGHSHWQPCMHDQCPSCHGTGVKVGGGVCIHGLACPCPKCSSTGQIVMENAAQ